MENIGKAIKLLRQTHNLNQKDLAISAGLSKPYISEIENGRAIPSLGTLSKIGIALDVKPSEIMLLSEWYSDGQIVDESSTVGSIIHPKILAMMAVIKNIDK
jgi:transcriptional regulator with XRE-family HTH domain